MKNIYPVLVTASFKHFAFQSEDKKEKDYYVRKKSNCYGTKKTDMYTEQFKWVDSGNKSDCKHLFTITIAVISHGLFTMPDTDSESDPGTDIYLNKNAFQ